MARRFQKTPVVSEPYFAKGKKAKEGHSLLLVKLLPPQATPVQTQCQLQEISPAIH